MLYSTVTGNRLLIGSRVEKADVERIPSVLHHRKEDRVGVRLGVVEVLAVTGKPADEHPMIFLIPFVDREEDEPLVQSPGVRETRHKRVVDHIPALAVILLLDIQHLEYCRAALADGEVAELRVDVRNLHTVGVAHGLDLVHDLLDHIFVVIIDCQ